ncbi:PREDICTED: uncharacterized protein LOC104604458 [Nelumbo nucifera]|uniref:Uncharacterized protein LOC104604458 n=2 Tax=Nelumbo nucifera TaxID=4432 RepID=A0A1U8AHG3_NELNU|nr:PREDICTED: uncharacterized protein LOC104604458 [Nelumbo nucifera]DAD48899.1 TPA_asm: hypothetical protein HUJ06_018836 [Nelumbo nucifera]
MAANFLWVVYLFVFHGFIAFISPSLLFQIGFVSALGDGFSIVDLDYDLFGHDYSPPSPPPSDPPLQPPSLSCEEDLKGIGSLNTSCQLINSLQLEEDSYIEGKGRLEIFPGVSFSCPIAGCSITINITGDFSLGENASIVAGTLILKANNASLLNGSTINTTALAGDPPAQTSGTPQGIDGAGGGHGGRGACCSTDNSKLPDDVWGGDAYSWSSLTLPWSYGSKGGTTSKEEDYGGGGGGRIKLEIVNFLDVRGTVLADGGDAGFKGGGGSGGSIYIKAHKMNGNGKISASGGNGFAGGGGGRVSINIYSRHDDPKILVHGGRSFGCPDNSGAAGTFYDTVPRNLIISNHNMSTNTDTLLLEFPNHPLWTNVYVRNHAKATVPLLWSRVQVQGQLSILFGGVLSFGLAHYPSSEFELMAEELLMSDSVIKVYGALRMSIKMLLMWNSKMLIDGGRAAIVATSLLEASNLIVLKESSVIHSNANLGVHGQGLLNLSGPGDQIEAQRLILSLFYSIHVGPGSVLRGPLENATSDALTPKLYCEFQDCPIELLHPPEDCNLNSSLSFTLQICRVEDIIVEGLIEGSVIHFHRARTVVVQSSGIITASGLGCTGGVGRGIVLGNGVGSGGGHGGKGGDGYCNGSFIEGGAAYGNAGLPCELGSGSGNESMGSSTAGGGIIVMGSLEHSLSSLSIYGSLKADGESFEQGIRKQGYGSLDSSSGSPGGGSGGTILLFLRALALGDNAVISSVGGQGSQNGSGGGGGGRIHFDWSDILTGDEYQPIASIKGSICTGGGLGRNKGLTGENGTVTGKACPKGLYGIFCEECPAGTFKNVVGSDKTLCHQCPPYELPHRAIYMNVRGGVSETPCPYKCISDRYHMPHCYTALEELVYTFGGPWFFSLLLLGLLILLALVLSVARMKFVGTDELPGPAPTQHGSQINHSFPFLESLNEVLETNRAEESQNHVHRMYFMGPNTFSEPWHLPHSPPEQVMEIVYEDAFNRFVDDINALAAYQWWEGAAYSILSLLAYPLAWSWQQWRRKKKVQQLREFVRSEYDHACLRSCRSRALYEGLKVAATSDLMLAYVDFFLGGDEKRTDLPPRLHQRFPMPIVFGGDGSYMAPFSLQSDNVLTSLMSQSVPSTIWYRLVAGLNAHLRLIRHGRLRITFLPVLSWLETHANPALSIHGVRVDLAWFQATTCGYCQFGLLVYAIEEESEMASTEVVDGAMRTEQQSRANSIQRDNFPSCLSSENIMIHKRLYGKILNTYSIQMLQERKDIFYPFSFIVHNTKPVGQQDLVGLVISILLLGDFSLVLLTLLQLYSISLVDFLLVLLLLPLGILFPFPAGINALFSHGSRRSAGLGRVYALWNISSLFNVVVVFVCGFVHYKTQSSSSRRHPNFQPWNFNMDESGWWMLPTGLVLCKLIQARLTNWHVANLEIQDRSLYSNDPDLFWQS